MPSFLSISLAQCKVDLYWADSSPCIRLFTTSIPCGKERELKRSYRPGNTTKGKKYAHGGGGFEFAATLKQRFEFLETPDVSSVVPGWGGAPMDPRVYKSPKTRLTKHERHSSNRETFYQDHDLNRPADGSQTSLPVSRSKRNMEKRFCCCV